MERKDNIFEEAADKPQGSLFSCIKPEGSSVHECAEQKPVTPSMQPPPPPPASRTSPKPMGQGAPAPAPPVDDGWKREILTRLARAEAVEKELRVEISALYTRLDRSSGTVEEVKRTAQTSGARFKDDLERLRKDLAGSLNAGFARLEERLAAAEGTLNSLGSGGGPFAAKSDLDPLSRELGAIRFELSSLAGRADSLARALPELSRIVPKVDLLEGGYSEFLQSLRKVYEIDSRYSYLSGRMEEIGSSIEAMASGRTKDQDRFSRLEVKSVELEGRADHLSSLFTYFRDMLEKFTGLGAQK
ncbi:MAG TPA: hypothetical protein DDW67_06090 [Elusimicrobia bacterium]|nr:hypothetical protein [Elusimicrobiota bacterium]